MAPTIQRGKSTVGADLLRPVPGTAGTFDYVPPGSSIPPSSIPVVSHAAVVEPPPASVPAAGAASGASGDYSTNPNGYAKDWNTVRFSNTQDEPITVRVTVGAGQSLPPGVRPDPADPHSGEFTIPPNSYVDITFAPGTSVNFKSTKGDGSVWNQGELFFREDKTIWGNMSYIYGANSNMRIFSSSGQHAGYLGDILSGAPPEARVGNWGIVAPFDGNPLNNDPNNPNSATGGPDGAKNAGSAYLYSILEKGEGYVGRGRPAEVTDYDDASSLNFIGNVAVVF